MKLLILFAACTAPAAAITVLPIPFDTVYLSDDPLRLVNPAAGRGFGFSMSEVFEIDSSTFTWKIDGHQVAVQPQWLSFDEPDKTSDYERLKFATGVWLGSDKIKHVGEFAAEQIHRLELQAHLPDTAIEAHWFFSFTGARYTLIRALVRIDSVYTDHGNRQKADLRIIEPGSVDTSIFALSLDAIEQAVAIAMGINDTASMSNFGTIDIERHEFEIIPRDTLDCFIIQYNRKDLIKNAWHISRPIDTDKAQQLAPFSLHEALAAWNTFIQNQNIQRGYAPPPGPLKLGPYFSNLFIRGDPGWGVSVGKDDLGWFFDQRIGSGDCPAGCITNEHIRYRISKPMDNDIQLFIGEYSCRGWCHDKINLSNNNSIPAFSKIHRPGAQNA